MKIIQAVGVTTHRVKGVKLSLKNLESTVNQSNQKYTPVLYDYYIRIPPIGRVILLKIVNLKDGEYGILTTIEIYED